MITRNNTDESISLIVSTIVSKTFKCLEILVRVKKNQQMWEQKSTNMLYVQFDLILSLFQTKMIFFVQIVLEMKGFLSFPTFQISKKEFSFLAFR